MRNIHSDLAYDYIRKRILNGEFPPGSKLAMNILSVDIGVSRTPVRDALRQLQADGLVTIQPRLGASVKNLASREFQEMCGLRLALESYAAEMAAEKRTEQDLQEIGHALDAMKTLTAKIAAVTREDPLLEDLRREDIRFHVAIIAAARNSLLKKEILRLHLLNRLVSSSAGSRVEVEKKEGDDRRKAVLESHNAIFAAISASDATAARRAMADHIQDIVDYSKRKQWITAEKVVRPLTEEELSYQP